MTNYEKIKVMSVEEMADIFEMREFFAVAMNGEHTESRYPFAIHWLLQEAEE